jgi:hypothetical protein
MIYSVEDRSQLTVHRKVATALQTSGCFSAMKHSPPQLQPESVSMKAREREA